VAIVLEFVPPHHRCGTALLVTLVADHPGGDVMTEYVVMFPADNEQERAAATDAERQATFDVDFEFGQLLQERGGAVTGGAGLTHSSEARTLRREPEPDVAVSNGPYVASPGQLSGFFVVTCDDYDELVDAARVLTRAHPVVEIRPVKEF
jgi:hypothetical protein